MECDQSTPILHLQRMGKTSSRDHWQRGQNDGERIDRARSQQGRHSCFEKRAELQQRFGIAVVGFANGQ